MLDEIVRLYGLDPSAFIAERNALVRAWRKAGRKTDAAVIAALRRPSAVVSAINRAVGVDHATAVVWREALARAGEAQGAAIGGGGADDLRVALAHLRSTAAALADIAVRATGDDTKRLDIASALQTMSGQAADQAVAGVLGSTTVVDVDPFAGAPDPPVRERAAPSPRHGMRLVATPPTPPDDPPDVRRRKALVDAVDRLAAVVETRRQAVIEADEARCRAEVRSDEALAALADARSRLTAAHAALAAED